MKNITALLLSLFLIACTTTVIDDSERELPQETSPIVQDNPSDEMEIPNTISVDPAQSFIAFIGSRPGMSHEGRFNEFSADITLNESHPSDISQASVRVVINIASIETDAPGLTTHLLSEDFFDAAQYPQAIFQSTSIKSLGGDTYNLIGDLTIKEVTREVVIPAVITQQYLTAMYELNRLDFGVGEEGKIDPIVPVELKMVFTNPQ